MSGDEKSSSTTASDSEAEKPAETSGQYESEWTVRSCLQVLGGFMLLFNTYTLHYNGD